MSQLIQLRQRIKAINTIKKITHTMRLISMSSHSRLRSKEEPLKEYAAICKSLLAKIKRYSPDWNNPIITPSQAQPKKQLIILIGSQRGLCGNFNTMLFHYFEKNTPQNKESTFIIPVGKKAIKYCETKNNFSLAQKYPEITQKTLPEIAQGLKNFIISQEIPFTSVIVVSNILKSFFIQRPTISALIPFTPPASSQDSAELYEEYYWQQPPSELIDMLAYQALETELLYLLFQSLVAEQAARFISMDNATRNVQRMLETTQLQYNKLRQFKITKELTELSFNI